MEATRHFASAPWPKGLKLSSALGTVLLVGIGIAAYRAIPVRTGFTHSFGLGIALALPALILFSLLSTVIGYVVSPSDLAIQRLFWATHISLSGLQRVSLDPSICKGSIRIIGNAGLYGFTGLYQNERLGRFRLFATDLAHSVVLVLPGRTVVVTPAAPIVFVEHIHHIIPGTREKAPEHIA
jgi:Bacterial PH domain